MPGAIRDEMARRKNMAMKQPVVNRTVVGSGWFLSFSRWALKFLPPLFASLINSFANAPSWTSLRMRFKQNDSVTLVGPAEKLSRYSDQASYQRAIGRN